MGGISKGREAGPPLATPMCRGDLEKQHVYKKKAIKSKSSLGIFVSLNSNSKNLIFLSKLYSKRLN